MEKTNLKYYFGLGRRKSAIARARLYRSGKGIIINESGTNDYFNNQTLEELIKQPLILTGQDEKLRVVLKVDGGGKRGQAEAAKLAIARALNNMNEELRPTLKKAGLLTRDPREKERKKPGLKGARKAPQFSKR